MKIENIIKKMNEYLKGENIYMLSGFEDSEIRDFFRDVMELIVNVNFVKQIDSYYYKHYTEAGNVFEIEIFDTDEKFLIVVYGIDVIHTSIDDEEPCVVYQYEPDKNEIITNELNQIDSLINNEKNNILEIEKNIPKEIDSNESRKQLMEQRKQVNKRKQEIEKNFKATKKKIQQIVFEDIDNSVNEITTLYTSALGQLDHVTNSFLDKLKEERKELITNKVIGILRGFEITDEVTESQLTVIYGLIGKEVFNPLDSKFKSENKTLEQVASTLTKLLEEMKDLDISFEEFYEYNFDTTRYLKEQLRLEAIRKAEELKSSESEEEVVEEVEDKVAKASLSITKDTLEEKLQTKFSPRKTYGEKINQEVETLNESISALELTDDELKLLLDRISSILGGVNNG